MSRKYFEIIENSHMAKDIMLDISKDLLHLKNQQFLRNDPMFIYSPETRRNAQEEIQKMKPEILIKIAKAGGLDKVDEAVKKAGNTLLSKRIEGLDLTELLR